HYHASHSPLQTRSERTSVRAAGLGGCRYGFGRGGVSKGVGRRNRARPGGGGGGAARREGPVLRPRGVSGGAGPPWDKGRASACHTNSDYALMNRLSSIGRRRRCIASGAIFRTLRNSCPTSRVWRRWKASVRAGDGKRGPDEPSSGTQ